MTESHETPEPLSHDELERAQGEPLPGREVMSTLDPSLHLGPPVPGDLGPDPIIGYPTDPAADA